MEWNTVLSLFSRLSGVSNSATYPWSITNTLKLKTIAHFQTIPSGRRKKTSVTSCVSINTHLKSLNISVEQSFSLTVRWHYMMSSAPHYCLFVHDDVIIWKHFPLYWPFVRGIHRSPVNSSHKGQWRGALSFDVFFDLGLNERLSNGLRHHRAIMASQ